MSELTIDSIKTKDELVSETMKATNNFGYQGLQISNKPKDDKISHCACCGGLWNNYNLLTIQFKNHTLKMCSDCARDFLDTIGDGRASMVEELKIIRAKITACTAQGEGNFCDIHNNAIKMARKVVDNRISELKGE